MRAALALVAGIILAGALAGTAGGATAVRTPRTLTPALAAIARGEHPVAKAARGGAKAVTGAGGLLLRDGRRYVVDVIYRHGESMDRSKLRAAGARVVATNHRYRTITVSAPAPRLAAIGRLAGVQTVAEDLAPMVNGVVENQAGRDSCRGAVVSEGDSQLRAAKARARFGVNGKGVTVGVLSNSFDRSTSAATHAADDVASHDLPGASGSCQNQTPVNVLQDTAGSSIDEGRAMLQVVHDLAPGAKLDFATGSTSETTFAQNIRALADAGADVIVDDIVYFDEPFFQDGPVANAVNDVRNQGVAYFSAATNENVASGAVHDAGSLEAASFRDSGSCPAGLPAYAQHCMDFDPGQGTDNAYSVTIGANSRLNLDLQWAQPWFGVSTDLDVYITYNGVVIPDGGFSETPNATGVTGSSNRPFAYVSAINTSNAPVSVDVAINRCDAACGTSRGHAGGDSGAPRLKLQFLENGRDSAFPNEYVASGGGNIVGPSIFGHAGAPGAIAVAAVPYDDSSAPEDFSSPGPVTHYFGPTAGTTPAAALDPPEVFDKPDVAATDCGLTTFFSSNRPAGDFFRFCGTSEAAPHAAAVAALQLQANRRATPAEIRKAQGETARPVGDFGHANVGSGLIDAVGAVDEMAAPKLRITSHPAHRTASRRGGFQLAASEPAKLRCSLDGDPFEPCHPRQTYRHLMVGQHRFRAKGKDGVGQVGNVATFSWRVVKRHHHR